MALFKITGENLHVFNGEKFIRSIRSLYHYSEVQWRSMELRMNKQFRCKDDDGVVYFWGVCSSYSFDPLDLVSSMVVLASNTKTALRACGRFCDGL